jgi:serine phosphatase RsbU (regulator of sigma subunit)
MLGMAFLNDIVNKFKDIEPNEILNRLRDHIIETLHQEGKSSITKDGMDMVMCKIDKQKTTLRYACANNPLYLIRNGELLETRGEKMPVAIHDNMEPFQLHTVKIIPGDAVYIFSDGYADQFGGPNGKKFMYKRLRELFLSLQDQPMKSQGEILEQTIVEWKGTTQQIDDIVVIGIKF